MVSVGEELRCKKCNQYAPDRCTCNGMKLTVGGFYKWKNQQERLIYMGIGKGSSYGWHQFALRESPEVVWCEVLKSDMGMLEADYSDRTASSS